MRRLIFVALILLLTLTSTATLCRDWPRVLQDIESTPLSANKTLQRILSTAENHTYTISLESGQFTRLIIDRLNAEAILSVYNPQGRKLFDTVCSTNWATPVSITALQSGIHRIEMRSASDIDARYELRTGEVRFATPRDRVSAAADKDFLEGIRLLSQWREDASRKAIGEFHKALSQWQAAGEKREQAVTSRIIGEIHYKLGETDAAISHYESSLSLARSINDTKLEGEVLNSLGYALLYRDKDAKARDHFNSALKAGRDTNSYQLQIHALNNIGEFHYYSGEMHKSLEIYDQALELCRNANYRRGRAQILLNLGYSHLELSDMSEASKFFDQALTLWRAVKDPRGEAMTLAALGQLNSRSGYKQKALDLYSQAIRTFRILGDKLGEAIISSSTGAVYSDLEENRKALQCYERALELYKSMKILNGEAGATILVGKLHHAIGDDKKAFAYLQKAVLMIHLLKEHRLKSYALQYIGAIYDSMGDKKRALEYYDQSLVFHRKGGDLRGEAYALSQIGKVIESLGDKEKAINHFNQALNLNRKAANIFGEISTLYNIARIQRNAGQLFESRTNIESALEKAEIGRTRVVRQDLRDSYLAIVRQSYDLHIDVLMMLDEKQRGEGFAMEAMEASERARARALIEMLIEARDGIYQGVDSSLVERKRLLQQQINEKAEHQIKLLEKRHTPEESAKAEKELEDAIEEYQQAHALILSASPRYAALAQPAILTAREIQQQLLDRDTALVEFALGDDRSYIWVITQQDVTTRVLPGRAEIEKVAREVYQLLTEPNREVKGETEIKKLARVDRARYQYWKASARLSRMIFDPVAEVLKKKRLLIVADGALQYIPFAALPSPRRSVITDQSSPENKKANPKGQAAKDSYRPMLIDYEITYLPSASTLAILRSEAITRNPASKSIALIADPVFSKDDSRFTQQNDVGKPSSSTRDRRQRGRASRLPFSHKEADAIVAAFEGHELLVARGFDASRERVMSEDLSQYKVVHFATHGFINSEHPELSEILLSLLDKEGRGRNGSLRLHEIYGLKLSAELVVLSACQTALGKDVRGEGLIGLTRGFMYAGASRVMASLWSVDDAATASLMGKFYKKMMRDKMRPAEALRDAQREMFEQQPRLSPYYWAAFTLQGEWK